MTTPEAAARYLNEHLLQLQDRYPVIHNPHNKPLEDLPHIMVFNNTDSTTSDWNSCIALADSGHCLGSHICSNEKYMYHDLGVLENCRPDRHIESYRPHYPDGYIMEAVPSTAIKTYPRLQKALALATRVWELQSAVNGT